MQDSQISETVLDNGIRVVTEWVPHAQSVAIGLRVDAGSRDEPEEQAGISHLLEHMLFKGTERRTARDIAEELDAVGGHLDAFTSKEYTGYSVRVLPEHAALAMDVLSDMLRHSLFDASELELEKNVILEEHRSLEDAPEEFVQELFTRSMWPTHPLGRPIIGRPEVVVRLTREDLLQHLATFYVPERLICAAAGKLEHDAFVRLIDAHFGSLEGPGRPRELTPPVPELQVSLVARPTEQAHFCLGTAGVSEEEPERWPARVLNLILGGGMSSRLFQEIREKRGLCYGIGSEMLSYREGGMFVVFADTRPEQLDEVRDLIRQELLHAAGQGITAAELARAREQVRSALLLSLDDLACRMSRLARSLLYYGRILSLEELLGFVQAVTVEDCARIAERLFGGGEFAFAAVGPFPARKAARRTARRKGT